MKKIGLPFFIIVLALALSSCANTSVNQFAENMLKQGLQKGFQQNSPNQLINNFMAKLLIEDIHTSAQAVMPYTHKSNFNAAGTKLSNDLMYFGFKKAHNNARNYQYPVQITREQALRTTEIGHPSRGTYQRGKEIKYWIAKKSNVAGVPAPLVVFFPEDGSKASISYMNSL